VINAVAVVLLHSTIFANSWPTCSPTIVFSGLIEAKEKRKIDFSYVIKWPVTAGTGKIEVV
jgi:hypothetical protein